MVSLLAWSGILNGASKCDPVAVPTDECADQPELPQEEAHSDDRVSSSGQFFRTVLAKGVLGGIFLVAVRAPNRVRGVRRHRRGLSVRLRVWPAPVLGRKRRSGRMRRSRSLDSTEGISTTAKEGDTDEQPKEVDGGQRRSGGIGTEQSNMGDDRQKDECSGYIAKNPNPTPEHQFAWIPHVSRKLFPI